MSENHIYLGSKLKRTSTRLIDKINEQKIKQDTQIRLQTLFLLGIRGAMILLIGLLGHASQSGHI